MEKVGSLEILDLVLSGKRNLGCFGDGGAITTNDEKVIQRINC